MEGIAWQPAVHERHGRMWADHTIIAHLFTDTALATAISVPSRASDLVPGGLHKQMGNLNRAQRPEQNGCMGFGDAYMTPSARAFIVLRPNGPPYRKSLELLLALYLAHQRANVSRAVLPVGKFTSKKVTSSRREPSAVIVFRSVHSLMTTLCQQSSMAAALWSPTARFRQTCAASNSRDRSRRINGMFTRRPSTAAAHQGSRLAKQ